MIKRIALFLMTNIAVIAVLMTVMSIFNVKPYLSSQGINYESLLIFAAVIGFIGSFISLFLSKWMAKNAYGIQLIEKPNTANEQWLFRTVEALARKANINMPELGIYDSPEPNAFATGWNKNNSLVAVSSSLLQSMNEEELIGVLGHEISHIANGDMVTMALIQGVVNTFVIFFARIAAYAVTQFIARGENNQGMNMLAYYGTAIIFEIIFGILASMIVMAFSRYREYRADHGSVRLSSKQNMISALRRLKQLADAPEDNRAPAFAAFKISSQSKILLLFASHPPLDSRIKALQ